jgi:hypothetical protein
MNGINTLRLRMAKGKTLPGRQRWGAAAVFEFSATPCKLQEARLRQHRTQLSI